MKIPRVTKIEEAYQYLHPYTILNGVFYSPLEKHIKEIFVGISDGPISYAIYSSKYGEFPVHDFERDLENLYLWAVFPDKSVLQVQDLLNDPDIVELLKKGTLKEAIKFPADNDWHNPLKIPRGLSAIIWLDQPEGSLEIQVKDLTHGPERSIIINDLSGKERINMHYFDYFKDMKDPRIRFRASETISEDVELTVEFTDYI